MPHRHDRAEHGADDRARHTVDHRSDTSGCEGAQDCGSYEKHPRS
jgi:hypothetical protein